MRKLIGSGHKPPSLTMKLFPTDTCLQRTTYFSAVESNWLYKSHLRAGPMPRQGLPTQNELNDIFIVLIFLSHLTLFEHFLSYWSFPCILRLYSRLGLSNWKHKNWCCWKTWRCEYSFKEGLSTIWNKMWNFYIKYSSEDFKWDYWIELGQWHTNWMAKFWLCFNLWNWTRYHKAELT